MKEEEEETSEDATVTSTANDGTVKPGAPPCPSMPQEKADKPLSQSEEEEAGHGEDAAGEAAGSPVHLDEEKDKSPGPEVLPLMSPSRTSPSASSPEKPAPASSPQSVPAEDEDSRSTPLSSPRLKGRRAILREAGSETPPRIPLCTAASLSHMASPPRLLKRQDEPMVVLHCIPTQRLHPEAVTADSDTDSASEEEEEAAAEEAGSEERSCSALKRKAAEQRSVEKKLRPSRSQDEATSPKTPPALSKVTAGPLPKAPPRGEGLTAEEWPHPAEETPRESLEERLTSTASKEPEPQDRTPPPAVEGPAPTEEPEPQIGPEALVCHEVDLDDLDDKEKPSPSPEHLLLMMRGQQQAPPLLPNLSSSHLPQPPVRPFLPAAALSPAPCPEELHTASEEAGAVRAEQEGDSSASSTSLQEGKDRGKTDGLLQAPHCDWLAANM